jgi:hypothetical protein
MIIRDALLALAVASTIVVAARIVVWAAAIAPVSEQDPIEAMEPCISCVCGDTICIPP